MKVAGKRIRELRKVLNIPQKDLSEFLGISQNAVSQWEVGERQPTFENLIKLCGLLETDPNFLLLGTEYHVLPNEQKLAEILDHLEKIQVKPIWDYLH